MGELDDMKALLRETVQIVNSNAKAIQANSNAIAELRMLQEATLRQIDELARETLEEVVRLTTEAESDRAVIREMQAEVRGLQTENRRILERLEQHFSDGHGAA